MRQAIAILLSIGLLGLAAPALADPDDDPGGGIPGTLNPPGGGGGWSGPERPALSHWQPHATPDAMQYGEIDRFSFMSSAFAEGHGFRLTSGLLQPRMTSPSRTSASRSRLRRSGCRGSLLSR